eukprot:TRINITY_DN5232_c0_g1_i3.p1 TRINITY_DN5232_c0_g1~~TRINITY_DN5232_c0_g1_i3.p1  ORF type:complete len:246 (-),score=59.42 TRINITY_DN5232_c0_g1_i3:6-743(-)
MLTHRFAILKINEEEIIQHSINSTEFLDTMCQSFYRWSDLIDVMYGSCTFSQVEKLQEEALKSIETMIKANHIKELCSSTRFTQVELEAMHQRFSECAILGSIDKEKFVLLFPKEFECFIKCEIVRDYIFNEIDKNGDGMISFQDYCHGLWKLMRGSPMEKVELCFRVFDQDKDELISTHELTIMMKWQYSMMGFSEDNITIMVEASLELARCAHDSDGDGKMNFEEFQRFCEKQPLLIQVLQLI